MCSSVHSDAVDQLTAAVDRLACDALDDCPPAALGDDLVQLRRQVDRLEAQFIRRLQRFDRAGGAAAEGAASTVSWLRGRCGLTGGGSVDRLRMARMLCELPATASSFQAGRAPMANVSLIARVAADVGADGVRELEPTLVAAAESLDAGRMSLVAAAARHRLDPDGALDEDNRNHDRRWFSCDQTYGGMFVLRGELDSEGGAILRTALDSLMTWRGAGVRTASQRRADALVDIASRQLAGGDLPVVHGQRPHLTLTVTSRSLGESAVAEPAELRGFGALHVETARRLACDAVRSVVGVDPGGAPLTVGRANRTIPPAIRTALVLRDKGCRFPGCDRPAEWTDGHHIRHWADGGETALPNLVLLCRLHHRMVHERGWAIRLEESGEVTVVEGEGRPRRIPMTVARAPTGVGAG